MDPIAVGLIVYLLVMVTVGSYAYRYMRSLDDFVLGGRRLGPWVTAISERASGESAWFLLGLPGAAYAAGFSEFWSVIGIAFGIFASWTLLAWRLRKASGELGALTLSAVWRSSANRCRSSISAWVSPAPGGPAAMAVMRYPVTRRRCREA